MYCVVVYIKYILNTYISFLVFFSLLDSTISGHVTPDFLRYRKIKVIDFFEVTKFWKVLINFPKVMIIITFYANYPHAMP